jgi:predicted RNA-binding Zn-ribbon protein involved in translation (DUF1610 family)
MTVHRAECQDCSEAFAHSDLLRVSDWADDHQRSEMHDVEIERAVATDGGQPESAPADDTTHTSIEVDAELWRQLRAEAIRNDRELAVQLEHVLRERYDEGAVVVTDGGVEMVQACPDCDSSSIVKQGARSTRHEYDDGEWRCQDCATVFAEPVERPAKRTGDSRQGLAKALADRDPEKPLVSDGGEALPKPIEWSFDAVVHGADVDEDCLALTGTGKPCSYNAYPNHDPVCNTHARADDPEIIGDAHQWARIDDSDATVTVCVNCELVVGGREPEVHVDCPECDSGVGERCVDETSQFAAPLPPHPQRRRRAYEAVEWFEPCSENPAGAVDEDQERLVTDGGQQIISVPVYAHVAGDGGVHCSYGARVLTVDTLTPPENTSFATIEWIEGKFHRQNWADEVIARIVPEPRRESLDVDKCRVGTLTADPAAGAIVELTFEEPDEIPGPNLSTDGGHGPAAASAGPQGPRDGQAFAGADGPHHCDLCGQVFETLRMLADHDCRPPGELLTDDGGEST